MDDMMLVIVDPETGEQFNLDTLTDRELDRLHLHLSVMQQEYRHLEQAVWTVLRQRAIANGGLDGDTRRWTVERRSYQTATVTQKRRGNNG